MSDEIRDVLIRLRTDATGVKQGNQEANSSFEALKAAGLVAAAAIAASGAAATALISTINRGQGVSELASSFDSLNSKAGASTTALSTLREATQGLLADTDLMRASNQALLAGLSPDQFLQVASAADAMGDAVGIDTKQSMDLLTNAVATGNDRLLKQFGIMVDNKKAEEEFAKSIGLTADKLNEAGKREAARIAILAELEKQTLAAGSASETAGDIIQQMGVAITNAQDGIARFVNESTVLVGALKEIQEWAGFAANGLRLLFSNSLDAEAQRLSLAIRNVQEEINSGGLTGIVSALGRQIAGEDEYEILADLKRQLEAVNAERAKGVEQQEKGTVAIDKQAQSAEELRKKYSAIAKEVKVYSESLGDLVDPISFVKLNATGFSDVFGTLGTFYGKEVSDAAQDLFKITSDGAKELEERNKEAFKNSVGFFEDILTSTITGSSQSLEQILEDALKRVAIGFGAQLLAQVAASMGGSGLLSQIGSASGLGQYLASSIFGGAGGSGIGPIANGSEYAASLSSSAMSMSSIAGSLTAIIPAAGVVAGGALAYTAYNRFQNSDRKPGDAAQAGGATYLAGDVTGISQTYFAISSLTSGDKKKRQESEARQNFLETLNIPLNENDYNINAPTGSVAAGAVGFGNALSHATTGGSGKLGADVAAIFANQAKDAKSFNEALITMQGLMGKLGLTAEDVKNSLTEAFLDGQLSLEEFGADIQNTNLLAQKDLVGENSISDAFTILAENIDKDPRKALKGLGFVFKELADEGIKTTAQIHDYIALNYPKLTPVFDSFAAQGIDSFEDIEGASGDTVFAIFNQLKPLSGVFQEVFGGVKDVGDGSEASANKTERSADRMVKAWNKVEQAANDAAEASAAVG